MIERLLNILSMVAYIFLCLAIGSPTLIYLTAMILYLGWGIDILEGR